MAISKFQIPGNIVMGEGCLIELANLEGSKAMVVTGGNSMKKNGFLATAVNMLKDGGFEVEVFDGVEANPSVKTCLEGKEAMLKFEPDWIVAIGGGSALDAAKAMWIFYEHPELTFEDIITPGSTPPLRNKAKLCCIPSTSGTASEVTAFSVITDTENHIKYPLVSEYMVPDVAIVDPVIPAKMPKHITANTGMDVLAHATEALVSSAASDLTDALALQAIDLVFEYLPIAYNEPDNMEAREKMHNASTIAGMAFTSASLGLVHSLAHKIGGEFGITHGLANAVLLPYIVQFNRKATDKIDMLEEIMGFEDYPTAVKELNRQLDIELALKDVEGFNLEDEAKFKEILDRMSENAYNDPCTLTNPRESNPEIVKMIFEHAYYGNDIED